MASQLKDSGIALTILANMLNRANKFYSSNKITDADNLYNLAFENLNILSNYRASLNESEHQAENLNLNQQKIDQELFQVKYKLMMAIIRCRRRMNDLSYAEKLCDQLIDLTPNQYESYYQRARVRRDLGKRDLALQDVAKAEVLSNNINDAQIKKLYESCYKVKT